MSAALAADVATKPLKVTKGDPAKRPASSSWPKPAVPSLIEVAARLNACLLAIYGSAGHAEIAGNRTIVSYDRGATTLSLSKVEARTYATWLEEGNIGSFMEYRFPPTSIPPAPDFKTDRLMQENRKLRIALTRIRQIGYEAAKKNSDQARDQMAVLAGEGLL